MISEGGSDVDKIKLPSFNSISDLRLFELLDFISPFGHVLEPY